ncbi:MAG: aspartate ammonia-lyase [Planctomycetota bacterium]|nr:aspartate ammonia-lyase [Planctomycetota bacterium]
MEGQFRTERDLLGEKHIPADALYGIHTARAIENFPLAGRPVYPELARAFGEVKLACAIVNRSLGVWPDGPRADAIEAACREMADGKLVPHVVVDALQGGAGTSTNMNVNEVIANRALEILGARHGDYSLISPADDINCHQSTNDTFPTALKLAAIRLLRLLEEKIVALQEAFQAKEKEFAGVVKVGRTQLQDAVLVTLGREMGAFAEALSRDRWRIYKCEERLRVVNLGGTAVGTGLGAPRRFIFRVVDVLRDITGIGFARAENLIDNTQNADVFVEVSGMLKAHAATLLKIAGDLRLMSSGPDAGLGEITLPGRQAGSSIMPGKVNPVIPEAVSQAAIRAMAEDQCISIAAGLGNLELNAFMPLIADSLLSMIKLLTGACDIFRRFCVEGIRANEERCRRSVSSSIAAVTALVPLLGYEKACEIAAEARASGAGIREVAVRRGLVTPEEFDSLVSPEAVCRLGSPDASFPRAHRGTERGACGKDGPGADREPNPDTADGCDGGTGHL